MRNLSITDRVGIGDELDQLIDIPSPRSVKTSRLGHYARLKYGSIVL